MAARTRKKRNETFKMNGVFEEYEKNDSSRFACLSCGKHNIFPRFVDVAQNKRTSLNTRKVHLKPHLRTVLSKSGLSLNSRSFLNDYGENIMTAALLNDCTDKSETTSVGQSQTDGIKTRSTVPVSKPKEKGETSSSGTTSPCTRTSRTIQGTIAKKLKERYFGAFQRSSVPTNLDTPQR